MEERTLEILSSSIANSLLKGIDENGYASLVVCGGKSPLPLYEKLSNKNLDWSKVQILLGDDRVVAQDHEDSNEQLIKNHLLVNNASVANFRSLLHPTLSKEYIKLPFDLVLLGLGNDGHFASLFPDQLNHLSAFDINAAPDFIYSDQPLGTPSYKRISMNLSMLLNAKRCILLVPSDEKRNIVEQAHCSEQLPLHFLLTQDKTRVEFSDLDFK